MTRSPLIIGVALLIVGTSLGATVFWLRLPSRMPTDADYRKVNALLDAQKQPGDIAILAPGWADRGRQFITALPVQAGYDLGGDVYEGTKRQWLVALRDVPRFSLDEARAALLSRGTSAMGGQNIGALYVEPFAIAGPPVAYSFLDEADQAEVSVGGPRGGPCRFTRNGSHQCAAGEWNRVQPGWYEVNERPAHCIWAHPVGEVPVLLTYHNVPLPAGAKIGGWAAFVGQSPAANGADVNLSISVDGRQLDPAIFPNQFGKQRFERLLPAGADHADITFGVTTANAGMRHFCFDAWVQPG